MSEARAVQPEAGAKGGPIAFYFDFSSPYGYIAAECINAVAGAQKRAVVWRPVLLGPIFKVTGSQPLVEMPLKREYARHDMQRSARLLKLPLVFPDIYPFSGLAACRCHAWLEAEHPGLAVRASLALLRSAFVIGRAPDTPEKVAAAVAPVVQPAGVLPQTIIAAMADTAVKDRVRQALEAAVAAGVFGSPWFIVDGEAFWGADRLGQVQHWLATGGW